MATVLVLDTTDTESSEFLPIGDQLTLVCSEHSSGEWLVEVKAPDGNWVKLVDFRQAEQAAIPMSGQYTVRLDWPTGCPGRLTGGHVGTKIYAIGVHGP